MAEARAIAAVEALEGVMEWVAGAAHPDELREVFEAALKGECYVSPNRLQREITDVLGAGQSPLNFEERQNHRSQLMDEFQGEGKHDVSRVPPTEAS
ncbi:MAG: hypothetical protein JW895_02860 [Thermoleophilaceae bacterium]|nr:hypothetical protein [Thermoleophilaceae bacterium]